MKTVCCLAMLVMVLLAACAPAAQESVNTGNPDQLYIVTTTSILADALRSIGGAHVYVAQIMSANTDPHSFVTSGRDQLALQKAKWVVYNGLGLESRMLGSASAATRSAPVFLASESISAEQRITVNGSVDPHVWMDVSLWETVVASLSDQLSVLDSAHAADYRANGQAYLNQLQELDRYIREQVNRLPPENRILITLHEAFNYFGKAYGFEVFAVRGITTDEPTAEEKIQQITVLILDRQISSIFTENSALPDDINTVVASVQSQGQTVTIAGGLYTDALGSSESEANSYIGMMRYNVDSIVTGLLGLPAE